MKTGSCGMASLCHALLSNAAFLSQLQENLHALAQIDELTAFQKRRQENLSRLLHFSDHYHSLAPGEPVDFDEFLALLELWCVSDEPDSVKTIANEHNQEQAELDGLLHIISHSIDGRCFRPWALQTEDAVQRCGFCKEKHSRNLTTAALAEKSILPVSRHQDKKQTLTERLLSTIRDPQQHCQTCQAETRMDLVSPARITSLKGGNLLVHAPDTIQGQTMKLEQRIYCDKAGLSLSPAGQSLSLDWMIMRSATP